MNIIIFKTLPNLEKIWKKKHKNKFKIFQNSLPQYNQFCSVKQQLNHDFRIDLGNEHKAGRWEPCWLVPWLTWYSTSIPTGYTRCSTMMRRVVRFCPSSVGPPITADAAWRAAWAVAFCNTLKYIMVSHTALIYITNISFFFMSFILTLWKCPDSYFQLIKNRPFFSYYNMYNKKKVSKRKHNSFKVTSIM